MGEPRFAPGDAVRTRGFDPDHHTRLPLYARGHRGTVVDVQGAWSLADDRARGLDPGPSAVYTVRFDARDLWGAGEHAVTLHLWEDYLEEAP